MPVADVSAHIPTSQSELPVRRKGRRFVHAGSPLNTQVSDVVEPPLGPDPLARRLEHRLWDNRDAGRIVTYGTRTTGASIKRCARTYLVRGGLRNVCADQSRPKGHLNPIRSNLRPVHPFPNVADVPNVCEVLKRRGMRPRASSPARARRTGGKGEAFRSREGLGSEDDDGTPRIQL